MDHVAIVEKSIEAMEAGEIDRLAEYLSDDMVFHGVVLGELSKREFIEIMKALASALPDWLFHPRITLITDHHVMAMIQVTATHTHDLLLPGMPPVGATQKYIKVPKEMLSFTFDGDQVIEIRVEPVEGGDVTGLLAHLGVIPSESPTAAGTSVHFDNKPQ